MPRRSKPKQPEQLRTGLIKLLENFEHELREEDLRHKVLALVPAYHSLRDLGCSLMPDEPLAAARNRILLYLRKYPRTVINGDELMVIGGIGEWARRVRELRKEFGWPIITGKTAKDMAKEGEFEIVGIDVERLKPEDYILTDEEQDREAALRWKMANEIRRSKDAVIKKILQYFLQNIGNKVTGEELRYIAKDKSEWARRARELRTDFGWQVMTKMTGMPDLPMAVYVLASDRQAPYHDRTIPDPVRKKVLQRDHYQCVRCGWRHEKWNPSDPRHLEPHHITHHAKGGKSSPENLITLCNVCHDEVHSG